MKVSALLAACVLASARALAADPAPDAVDPALAIVSTQADTRILVYHRCSSEHCWSETYLQALPDAPDKTVLCTTKVKEIFVGHSVDQVTWSFVSGGPSISIRVSASHGGFKPHVVTLTPLDGCRYTLSGVSAGS